MDVRQMHRNTKWTVTAAATEKRDKESDCYTIRTMQSGLPLWSGQGSRGEGVTGSAWELESLPR